MDDQSRHEFAAAADRSPRPDEDPIAAAVGGASVKVIDADQPDRICLVVREADVEYPLDLSLDAGAQLAASALAALIRALRANPQPAPDDAEALNDALSLVGTNLFFLRQRAWEAAHRERPVLSSEHFPAASIE